MATRVYDTGRVFLIDGTELYLTPLKIKYLREFMTQFESVKKAKNNQDAIIELSKCALIAMKQYYPSIKTVDDLEDSINLPTIYTIIDIAAGIKMNQDSGEEVTTKVSDSKITWENLDLAKLEAEAFLLGIWKDYEDLESSMSMPELVVTLESKKEIDYQEKKFLAAMQGVNLDEQTGKEPEQDPWEAMKARVFSGGQAANSNDIVSLQGQNAIKAGFGIGMGLSYEKID